MNTLKLICSLLFVLAFMSCNDEEPMTDNLTGDWRVSRYFVDGLGDTASGTISFNDSTSGVIDVWHEIEEDTIVKQGDFTFSQTTDEFQFTLDGNTMTWSKALDSAEELEFHFDEEHNQIEYSLVLEFVPQ